LSFLFDTGSTSTWGFKEDIRGIYHGQLPGANGSAVLWLADGTSRTVEYWDILMRSPTITNWKATRFYGNDNPQPGQRMVRLSGELPIKECYGAFQLNNSRLILANIVNPVRQGFLQAGQGR
jgi:hypothetical protein